MKNKFKKIGLIAILIIIIIAVIIVIINSSSGKKEKKTSNSTNTIVKSENVVNTNTVQASNNQIKNKEVVITQLSDGTKYSVSSKEVTPDIVIGDNYFGTQLNDINLNFSQYEGKVVEIEGLFIENQPYTFVGRYSTSVVCQDCPPGFSYFEYEWHGKEALPVTQEDSWLKIKGTLKKGNDGVEYYYIDADEVEIMNEKGIDTVNN